MHLADTKNHCCSAKTAVLLLPLLKHYAVHKFTMNKRSYNNILFLRRGAREFHFKCVKTLNTQLINRTKKQSDNSLKLKGPPSYDFKIWNKFCLYDL